MDECESQLRPRRVCTEGFVRGGTADSYVLTAQVVVEKASELGECIWFLKAALSDAFGHIGYPLIWKILERGVGAVAAHAFMKASIGRSTRDVNRGHPGGTRESGVVELLA